MKRLKKALPAMLLAIIMLAGCAGPSEIYESVSNKTLGENGLLGSVLEELSSRLTEIFGVEEKDPYAEFEKTRTEKIVSFSEMEYSRPDMDALEDRVKDVEEALEEGKLKLSEIEELLDKVMDEYHNFSTMESLANIRNCLDLSDEYYADEYEWISEQDSVVSDLMDELYYACGGSKYVKKLEKDYFWEGFAEEYANEEDSIYTPEFVELSQKESNLITEYRDILADPVITLGGREVNYDEILEERLQIVLDNIDAYLESPYDNNLYAQYYESYLDYMEVLEAYYTQIGGSLADIFIELVKTRKAMAEEAGYDSVEELEYVEFYDRDYTSEDAGEFIEAVEKYIVPLQYDFEEQLTYEYSDDTEITEEKIKACLELVNSHMGEKFEKSYEFMTKYDLYDFTDGENKTPMSFETYLDSYEAPYLLISPSNSVSDVMTAIHEFGHYNDSFIHYGTSETIDLAEVYSQGLEILSLGMLGEELGADAVKALGQSHVLDSVNTYTQQCAFAEFEREVYALPDSELTDENINEIAMDLGLRFGFMSEDSEDFEAYYWVTIPHFFESPFYVISYPVSLNVALQFYDLEREEEGAGIAKYNEMVEHESAYLLETVEEYEMDSPFEASSVRKVANILKKMAQDFS